MKKRKLTIDDLSRMAESLPILSKEDQASMIGGDSVRISVNRTYYGDNSTMSHFAARAYDDSGNIISEITGVFLEPTTDPERSRISGSDTAIPAGTYDVVPSTYKNQSGYYEISGVDGRSAIKIHAGNTGDHTEGCLLPGTTGIYDEESGESTVSESGPMLKKLTEMMDKHGDGGIKINISE